MLLFLETLGSRISLFRYQYANKLCKLILIWICLLGIFVLLLSCGVNSTPPRDARDIHNREIVGQATNIITSKLLKGSIEHNKNYVFSPLGYAAILAILGEGAAEDTNHDITTVLKYPDNRLLVRGAYRAVLAHLQGLDPQVAPQFRSWFYIYKNYTVDDEYRQILSTDYYVTVKNVEPYNPEEPRIEDEATTQQFVKVEEPEMKSAAVPIQAVTPTNSKDIVEFDSFKMEAGPVDETRIDLQNDASKFDEVVEDRQYVEVPIIKGEMKKTVKVDEVDAVKTVEVTPDVSGDAQVEHVKTVQLPIKQYAEMEIMQAEESRFGKAVSASGCLTLFSSFLVFSFSFSFS